jgi:hypothetical protein
VRPILPTRRAGSPASSYGVSAPASTVSVGTPQTVAGPATTVSRARIRGALHRADRSRNPPLPFSRASIRGAPSNRYGVSAPRCTTSAGPARNLAGIPGDDLRRPESPANSYGALPTSTISAGPTGTVAGMPATTVSRASIRGALNRRPIAT